MPPASNTHYKVLVIGGYGFFGKKLAERLARDPLLQVVIAGRSLVSATALTDRLNIQTASRRFASLAVDANDPRLSEIIASISANVVVHTSGPFQGRGYQVARACIAARVHYIDLADARNFVNGIGSLDDDARRADVFVTSGASSVPALSGAVVDRLSEAFARVDSIDIGISPGNRTERGLATVSAILSYSGMPIPRWRDGAWQKAFGWQDLHRQHYPKPVGNRWLVNCDVPDLELFPARYPHVKNVRFSAGLELPFLHFGLWALAGMRRAGLVSNLQRHASMLKKASDLFIRFGSNAGAMHVEISGADHDQQTMHQRWTLLAEAGDGPFVPTLASAALVARLARDDIAFRGAQPCVGILTLDDFMQATDGLAISTNITTTRIRNG